MGVIHSFQRQFSTWALRRQQVIAGTITLNQRSIYILPTREGLAFSLVLLVMLLGDINYNISLGYGLTFLLAMMGVVSMLHAFRNLAKLEIRAGRSDPVFCGETAQFRVHVNNRGGLTRYRVGLAPAGHTRFSEKLSITRFDIPPRQDISVLLPVPATRRGWLQAGRLTMETTFPLGLFRAWSYLYPDMRCLVYPEPMNAAPLPSGAQPDGTGLRATTGDEDFSGLRNYAPGDALQRVDWKTYARERGLHVKVFSTHAGDELWLDFHDAPDRTDEEKLARMTRWVLDAEAQGLRYGLRLPDGEVPPGSGPAHRGECLRRLALFGLGE